MRRSLLLLLLLGCSQPPSPGSASSTIAAAPLAPDAPAAAPAAPATTESDLEPAVPTERFSDAQRSFEDAKKTLLEQYYDGSFTEEDLYRAAVAGMLERLDPKMHEWNKLLSPSQMADLRSDLQGEIVGIGIVVELDAATGYIQVKRTFPGSPAEHAGIAPPDQIVTVDGQLFRGHPLRDAVTAIRGKAGETVTLSILRGDKLVSVPVVRAKVAYDQVTHMMLDAGVGYVAIPAFNARTSQALHDALTDLASKGARSLVVDFRHSPGGSFDDAIASVGELVPAGSTVTTLKKRAGDEAIVPKTAPVFGDGPVAVLVDHGTASSSELVTAALQDLRHAVVVGSRTSGKWSVQKLEDLPNGYAVKYTVALFTSPSGKCYDGTGLAPDVEVDQPDDTIERVMTITDPVARRADDVQLRTALTVLAHGR